MKVQSSHAFLIGRRPLALATTELVIPHVISIQGCFGSVIICHKMNFVFCIRKSKNYPHC